MQTHVKFVFEWLADLKQDCEERLAKFVADYEGAEPPLPAAGQAAAAQIDSMHADIVQLQDEKIVHAGQVCPVAQA